MSATCWPRRRCPKASPAAGDLRERRIAYKTGTSAGFAMPGRPATATTGRSSYGSAMPTARRGPASSAATPRCRCCSRRSAACRPRTIIAKSPPSDVLRVASHRELPVRMRTLGPTGRARQPAHLLSAGRCPHRAGVPRSRAAGGQGRQRQPALAGRRWAGRRHQMGARRSRHCPRRGGRRGGPFQRRHRAHHRSAARAKASTTDASRSTAKATLIVAVGARLAEEARQHRTGQQPGDVHGGDDQRQQRPA